MTQKIHEERKFKKIHESAAMWELHTVQGHQMKGQEPTSPYRESWRKVIILAISANLNSRSSERHLHVRVWNICYISETKKMYSQLSIKKQSEYRSAGLSTSETFQKTSHCPTSLFPHSALKAA